MRENEPVADTPDFSLLLDEIKLWLSSPLNNRWFSDGKISVYVRKSSRKYERAREAPLVAVIDLANIVVEAELQGQGLFKAFIEQFERSVDRPIYVENVLNSRFQRFWIARGYQPDAYHEFCYWGPPVR